MNKINYFTFQEEWNGGAQIQTEVWVVFEFTTSYFNDTAAILVYKELFENQASE